MLPQNTVDWSTLAGTPADNIARQGLEIKVDNDLVTLLNILHLTADAYDITCQVRAGDDVLLDGEGVEA